MQALVDENSKMKDVI